MVFVLIIDDGCVVSIRPFEEPDDLAAYTVWAAETDPNASAESDSPPNAPIGGVISIESAAAAASTNNDDSYSYLLTAFASGPVAAPTNGSFAFTSNTTTKAVATSRSSAGSSGSHVSSITSVVMVTPTSPVALTRSTSATISLPAPSASTTKKGTAGMVGVGDTGLAMLVLLGIMLAAG